MSAVGGVGLCAVVPGCVLFGMQGSRRGVTSQGVGNEALRASSGVLKYSFGFLAAVLLANATAGVSPSQSPVPAHLHFVPQ